ncbi:MAG TPA: MBL fold metallo-hydrolase [Solirubrobacteraceae bacterium]|nr:MBL fold metallo-hydrolase [Solirubrobacteraceae bacterium]
MSKRARERELGRGERVLTGLWRLRLPLPWPGVPHGNAWAIAAGDGLVLVDTGVHGDDSMEQLERAMDQVGLHLEQVKLLVITHAHNDHWGQALPIVERAGCEMWVHPASEKALAHLADPEADLRLRLEVGRQSGIPQEALDAYAERELGREPLFAGPVASTQDLVDGVQLESDLGTWQVHETPGHAASHVCLYQPEHRLLISGDHLLGRIVLWFDRGDTPDPVAEYLRSLDVVAGLRARLALSGHGKPFLDVPGHIEGSRRAVREQIAAAVAALARDDARPRTALEVADTISDGRPEGTSNAVWRLPLTLCVLEHLERAGRVTRESDGELERWRVVPE